MSEFLASHALDNLFSRAWRPDCDSMLEQRFDLVYHFEEFGYRFVIRKTCLAVQLVFSIKCVFILRETSINLQRYSKFIRAD